MGWTTTVDRHNRGGADDGWWRSYGSSTGWTRYRDEDHRWDVKLFLECDDLILNLERVREGSAKSTPRRFHQDIPLSHYEPDGGVLRFNQSFRALRGVKG